MLGSPEGRSVGIVGVADIQQSDRNAATLLYNSHGNVEQAPPLVLPQELESSEYAHFLCYTEWKGDYRYVLDNVIDPMHGNTLHKQPHSLACPL